MGSRLTEAVETDESLWSFTPQRCPTCNCNIKTPSFASVSQRHLEVASLEDYWRGGSWQIGCSFCKMVSSLMGNICNSTTVEDLTYRRPAGVDFVRLSEAGDKYQLMLQVSQDWAFEWSAGVCLQGPSPFSDDLLPFNDIPVSPESPEARERAKKWLFTCKTSHEQCCLASSSDHFVPTRLLKLGSDKVYVVITSDWIDHPEYVALSYCWGAAQPLTTTTTTLYQNKAGIPLGRIPRTLLDAINVTKALGFQFLWIDSLCIIQNDADDWLRESAQMERVYGNAQVVLAASVASSSSEGFLRNRLPYTNGICTVSPNTKARPFTIKYRLACSDSISPAPLDTRAWAFQERTLARRYLMFGQKEMKWVCKEAYLREAFPDEMKRHDQSNLLLFNNVFEGGIEGRLEQQQAYLTKQWRRWVVPEYTKRNLTKRSDKLVALSAVASRFQSVHRGTYLAGLWKEDLLRELAWTTSGHGGGPEPDFAPSWSWASVKGGVEYSSVLGENVNLAQVIDSSVVWATSNPFGSVCEGTLKLRGKVFQGLLFQKDDDLATHKWRLKCDIFPRGRLGAPSLDMDIAPCSTNPQSGETGTGVTAMRISGGGASKDLGQNNVDQANKHPNGPEKLQVWVVPLTVESSNIGTYVRSFVLGRIRPEAFQRLGIMGEWYTNRGDFDEPWDKLDGREIVLM